MGHETTANTRPANRLAQEKSPYLLQHQFNPVAWQPWGEQAFAQAQRENKLIFLSIGYSTCHWCHVMERESFEEATLARFLNEHFVSIKVDREERPDVDRVYMTFVQATTGQGGWPLNVFLTPDRKPFFGGTYFPPDNRYGRPSFHQVVQHAQQLWSTRRDEILASAGQMHQRLADAVTAVGETSEGLTPEIVRDAGTVFRQAYDPEHGGFGAAPKFPQPSQPRFLLRYARRFPDAAATQMVLHTCDRMAAGGIYDQLGGGFARYSVDAQWLVPHFEKMLYDNAQLVQLYLEAFLVGGEARHAEVARGILDYVRRDMTHPEGGFYSAEDADSEGHEGKFYCWTLEELSGLLTPEEFNVAVRYFGLTKAGNFIDHSHPAPLRNQNILSIADPQLSEADRPLLAAAKSKMAGARAHRVRPHLDDKILASWNGLMLGAFARAYGVLGDNTYRDVAERNLGFIQSRLWNGESRTLYHRWRDGQRDQIQLLTSYAFLLAGVLDLYEATLAPAHLNFALTLAESLLARFYDPEHGGFWQSAGAEHELILRVKEDYDGAEPAGSSVACLALLQLGHIAGRPEFTAAAEKSLRLLAHRLQQVPQALPCLLQALDFSLEEPVRAVVVGDPAQPETRALLHILHTVYLPNKVVLGNRGPVEPFARSLPIRNMPTVFLCTGTACQESTGDPQQLRGLLQRLESSRAGKTGTDNASS